MREFSGRTAVITGGASGIGLGMARSFAKRGMQLVLADLDEKLLQAAEQEFAQAGVAVECRLCDASKLEDIEGLAKATMDRFGGVHVVCSNAGVGIPTSARNLKLSDWEWI
ncbi:MAG: SDR family NAD(P)-dependent oxidoreductase, partial [Pseudomonadota bacterium]|nr:SDR family NAD(P)-dependent oxidoreductase [Pseudomonadota bacterium]